MDANLRGVSAVWAFLIVLTGVSLLLGESTSPDASSNLTFLAVIVLACIKVRTVILHFMEIKDAPWLLRGLLELWVVAVGAMIVLMH